MLGTEGGRSVRLAYGAATIGLLLGTVYLGLITVDAIGRVVADGDRPVAGESLDVAAQVPPEQLSLPDGYRRAGWIEVTATIDHPKAGELLSSWAVEAARGTLVVTILWLLRRIVSSVRAGTPFDARNVRRLRAIGSILLLGFPAVEILAAGVRSASLSWIPPVELGQVGTGGPEVPLAALLAGLGVHVVAAVFAEGLRLHEDVEGTI